MADAVDRRFLIAALSMAGALPGLASPARAAAGASQLTLGRPFAFSFDHLKQLAQTKVAQPYSPPPAVSPEVLQQLSYAAWGAISFDTDYALFKDSRLPVTFFHLGRYFQQPERIYAVQAGQAREVVYDARYFHMPADSPAHQLPPGVGFAGFRVQEPRDGALDWRTNDWVAFLGASYFRAIGALRQYGLSARTVALDTAVADRGEEFPAFTNVFLEQPHSGSATITVYALLEGPSIVGACRFQLTRGEGVVIEVDLSLHMRRNVERFGIAPITSMYWFSETAKPEAVDWRPEVHDSDGLAMWTGAGERLWRPLNNPPKIAASAFSDDNPKGFGLMQRDRNFDHYLDGVLYDRRPSLWVEPKGAWGKGSVQLIEFPTNSEINDNLFAAWVPQAPAVAGDHFEIGYTLYWLADEPHPSPLARCVATRLGEADTTRAPKIRQFVVEFLGGALVDVPAGARPEPSISASRGRVEDPVRLEPVPDGVAGHWRVMFNLTDLVGDDPVELRMTLALGGRTVTEVWIYQYHPF